jgi:hypothetical protein
MPATKAFMADQSTAKAEITAGRLTQQNVDSRSDATAQACVPCAAGYFCPTEGLTAMKPCPAGTYSPAHSDRCFECRAGRLCPNEKTTSDAYANALCAAGKMCPRNTAAAQDCPEGHYCGQEVWAPEQCPAGTFGPATGKTKLD